jgi:hypothetical protein
LAQLLADRFHHHPRSPAGPYSQIYMKPFVAFCVLIFAGLATTWSCRKDTDCKVMVRCLDSLSRPVTGADVLLYAPVKSPDGKTTYTADLKASDQTNGDGEVRFVFKLPAIYDIKATKVVGTKTITGAGIVKLEEGQTVEKEVTLK